MQKSHEDSKIYHPRVEILGTERRTITSLIANEKYDVYLNFPPSYWNDEKKTTYPVLYVLNGQWDFSMMLGSFGNQNFDGLIPEIIIVGITWSGGEDTILDFHQLGLRDFAPTKTDGTPSAEAFKFLSVLTEELVPFIESEYPVTEDRGLVGGSVSGLFVLYTMFNRPTFFKKYIVSSPIIDWGNSFILKNEAAYARAKNSLPARIFITWGEYENSDFIRHFITQIQSRNYHDFNLEAMEIKGTGHAGNKPECFTRGLLFAYKRPEILLSQQQLDKYTGQYGMKDNKRIEIHKNDKGLIVKWSAGDPGTQLYAETEFLFYMKGAYLFLYFCKMDQVKIEFRDKEIIATRIA